MTATFHDIKNKSRSDRLGEATMLLDLVIGIAEDWDHGDDEPGEEADAQESERDDFVDAISTIKDELDAVEFPGAFS